MDMGLSLVPEHVTAPSNECQEISVRLSFAEKINMSRVTINRLYGEWPRNSFGIGIALWGVGGAKCPGNEIEKKKWDRKKKENSRSR